MMRLALLAAAATASARVFDSLDRIPKGWNFVENAKATDSLTLRIALKQQHAAELEQGVIDMSTPGHENYGNHMSKEELRRWTKPAAATASSVQDWLSSRNVKYSVDNDWITVNTVVEAANDLLDAEFGWYEYEAGGGPQLRTLSYSVPDALAGHVDMIQPTTRFGQLGSKRSTIFDLHPMADHEIEAFVAEQVEPYAAQTGCTGTVTPACLKAQYNVKYTASPAGNLVAFSSYLDEYARYTDLQAFEKSYVPQAVGQNFSVTLINGGLNSQNSNSDSGEANLDAQYVLGLSNPIPLLEFSTGGLGPLVPTADEPGPTSGNEPYLEWLTYLLALDDSALPQTISTSYGEEEQSVPADYALKVCNMMMQLGARGVSILFSSGDSGPGDTCTQNTGRNATYFQPTFPAGCPYVTAVGATTGYAPESGVSFSSGGFSILHARPSWQDAAVTPYLTKIGTTYAPYFNRTNRGIPDVSAQGSRFAVYDRGRLSSLAGTSASAPTVAGIIALLNAARKASGQKPLGFLNPFLYNNTAGFLDITTGASSGCQGTAPFGNVGAKWNCTAGWDPVTGLGTPLFDKLLAVVAPGVANA